MLVVLSVLHMTGNLQSLTENLLQAQRACENDLDCTLLNADGLPRSAQSHMCA